MTRKITFLDRVKVGLLAFRHAKALPSFAVIYDSLEFATHDEDGTDLVDPVESYYEAFGGAKEANRFFRDAYPIKRCMTVAGTERLVLILGPIDAYGAPK